jgi:hypothetical protein
VHFVLHTYILVSPSNLLSLSGTQHRLPQLSFNSTRNFTHLPFGEYYHSQTRTFTLITR